MFTPFLFMYRRRWKSVYVFDMESSVSWNIQAAHFHSSSSGTFCNKNLQLWYKQTKAIQYVCEVTFAWHVPTIALERNMQNISSFAQHRDTAVRSRGRFLCLNESVTSNITEYKKNQRCCCCCSRFAEGKQTPASIHFHNTWPKFPKGGIMHIQQTVQHKQRLCFNLSVTQGWR